MIWASTPKNQSSSKIMRTGKVVGNLQPNAEKAKLRDKSKKGEMQGASDIRSLRPGSDEED